jgi:hypothetical protein
MNKTLICLLGLFILVTPLVLSCEQTCYNSKCYCDAIYIKSEQVIIKVNDAPSWLKDGNHTSINYTEYTKIIMEHYKLKGYYPSFFDRLQRLSLLSYKENKQTNRAYLKGYLDAEEKNRQLSQENATALQYYDLGYSDEESYWRCWKYRDILGTQQSSCSIMKIGDLKHDKD